MKHTSFLNRAHLLTAVKIENTFSKMTIFCPQINEKGNSNLCFDLWYRTKKNVMQKRAQVAFSGH